MTDLHEVWRQGRIPRKIKEHDPIAGDDLIVRVFSSTATTRSVPPRPGRAGAPKGGFSLNAHVTASALSPRLLHGLADDAGPRLRVEGTAVVVDISGFTTLSEQLAAAGREGTEQLIATLSRIFTVLLPSTDDGGDVVKFAGDALFVLFTGPAHARHAAHAAWNMNRVLTAIGDIHLPAARARLRMSVGVHSGVFEFFLSGGSSTSVVLTVAGGKVVFGEAE